MKYWRYTRGSKVITNNSKDTESMYMKSKILTSSLFSSSTMAGVHGLLSILIVFDTTDSERGGYARSVQG